MNHDTFEPKDNDRSRRESTLEVLISRLVDGETSDADWNEFRALAAQDHEPWRRLAEEQRLAQLLRQGFEDRTRRALAVELPGTTAGSIGLAAMVRRQVGWAAAIVILIGWLITGSNPATTNMPTSDNGLVAERSPDAMLASYMAAPHVIGQRDPIFLGQYQTENGLEIAYLRCIIERRPVAQAWDITFDESGNAILLPQEQPNAEYIGNGV